MTALPLGAEIASTASRFREEANAVEQRLHEDGRKETAGRGGEPAEAETAG